MQLFQSAPTKVLIKLGMLLSQVEIIFDVEFYLTFINI